MPLTKEKKDQMLENLKEKWPPKKRICYICGNNKFEMTDNIFQVSQYFPHVLTMGPIVPLIVVTCSNCGYTLLFNALTLQAIERPEKRQPVSEGSKNVPE